MSRIKSKKIHFCKESNTTRDKNSPNSIGFGVVTKNFLTILEMESVQAICGACGYLSNFQGDVTEALDVPVFLSNRRLYRSAFKRIRRSACYAPPDRLCPRRLYKIAALIRPQMHCQRVGRSTADGRHRKK